MSGKTYIAIDLKSFYASVECRELGLDPLTTNLVVADRSRTEKTICLAVSPSLRARGIPGRAWLFEVKTVMIATVAGHMPPSTIPKVLVSPSLNKIANSQKNQVVANTVI